MNIHTYDEAATALGQSRIAKLEKSTQLVRRDKDRIAVTFYGSDIVTYYRGRNTITLGTGYVPRTHLMPYQHDPTARRISTYTPESIHVRRSNLGFVVSDATAWNQHWDGLEPVEVCPA